jgi:hypothetical protein
MSNEWPLRLSPSPWLSTQLTIATTRLWACQPDQCLAGDISRHSGRYPIVAGGSSAYDVVPNGNLDGSIRASVASLDEQIATRLGVGKSKSRV